MNQSLKWISLVAAFAFLSTAKAEFEEPETKKNPRVVRPTVVCEDDPHQLNDVLKKLPVGSFKISHFAAAEGQYISRVCVVVEPAPAK